VFEGHIQKANQAQINFYEQELYPLQDDIFQLLQTEKFYLSGGTCLSRFYYDHRYSDDLDFFFDGFSYPKEEFDIVFRDVINRIAHKFKTEIALDSEYFKRGFVYNDDTILKIEFIYENYKNVGQRQNINELWIDSKENVTTNKLTAVYDRKTVKDFVDLYFLLQEINFDDVAKWAEYKIVPLDYEGALLALTQPRLEGIALLKKDISAQKLNEFAAELLKRMLAFAKKNG